MTASETEAVQSISMLLLLMASAALGSVARSYVGALVLSAAVFIVGQLALDFAGMLQETVLQALFHPRGSGILLGQLVAVWIVMGMIWLIRAGARRIVRGSRRAAAGSHDAGERTDHG